MFGIEVETIAVVLFVIGLVIMLLSLGNKTSVQSTRRGDYLGSDDYINTSNKVEELESRKSYVPWGIILGFVLLLAGILLLL